MLTTISVTEVARNFSDVINRIHYQRRSYLLTRGGTAVAMLLPTNEPLTGARLAELWDDRPHLDPHDAEAWAAELDALKTVVAPPKDTLWDS